MTFKLTKDIEFTGKRKRQAIIKNAYLRPIVHSAVYDWKEVGKAIKFFWLHKPMKFKIYVVDDDSDSWALFAIKNGNARTLINEGYYDPEYYGAKLVEIKSDRYFN